VTAVIHGGATPAEREGVRRRGLDLVDLSASLNPYGPHPAVVAAARSAAVDRYPEQDAATLIAAYASEIGVPPKCVLAGNGSSELIYLAVRAFGRPGCPAVILGPTFGEYARAASAATVVPHTIRAIEPAFDPPVDALLAVIAAAASPVVFICNPNNPTGRLLAPGIIETIASATGRAGGFLVLDEAYLPFTGTSSVRTHLFHSSLFTLHSSTKLHAIAGLRLGFAVGDPAHIARVRALQPPWAVSAPAIAAGLAALAERDWARSCVERMAATRGALAERLACIGLPALPSSANFLLVDVEDAAAFRRQLLERGFAVRDCSSFGLPRFVRIAVPHEEHLSRLCEAVERCR
jgi:threonine-phosphate decarboxylase